MFVLANLNKKDKKNAPQLRGIFIILKSCDYFKASTLAFTSASVPSKVCVVAVPPTVVVTVAFAFPLVLVISTLTS